MLRRAAAVSRWEVRLRYVAESSFECCGAQLLFRVGRFDSESSFECCGAQLLFHVGRFDSDTWQNHSLNVAARSSSTSANVTVRLRPSPLQSTALSLFICGIVHLFACVRAHV